MIVFFQKMFPQKRRTKTFPPGNKQFVLLFFLVLAWDRAHMGPAHAHGIHACTDYMCMRVRIIA